MENHVIKYSSLIGDYITILASQSGVKRLELVNSITANLWESSKPKYRVYKRNPDATDTILYNGNSLSWALAIYNTTSIIRRVPNNPEDPTTNLVC